jgi:GcrA cell cycle regulator
MGVQNTTWTPARIDMLQELWGSGLSAKEIAGRLGGGITRNAVIGKAHRLGLSSRPSPIKRVEGEKIQGSIAMKTRASAPKTMGLRRDVMVGSGIYRAPANSPNAMDSDMRRGMRSSSSDASNYSPRVFKSNQASNVAPQTQTQQCRWPVGDPLKAGFHFCDHMAIPGLPYCYDHACLAYQGSKKKSPSAPREEGARAEGEEAASFGIVNNS